VIWRQVAIVTILWFVSALGPALAHEVNPAFLELTETGENQYDVVWKQPLKDGRRLKLDPQFPEECERSPEILERAPGAVVSRWKLTCALDSGRVGIDGLERTLTDVFVRIHRLDGRQISSVLKPTKTWFEIAEKKPGAPLFAYLRIGVDHIIFGYDHLLFVLGLLLLVRLSQLFLTVTAFTVAHSITLGLSTLAGVTLPGPPVEAVIALSLILLAREAIMLQAGGTSLTSRYPWVIAFGFGLIHGFGFAGALAEIGLPPNQEVLALLFFNLGVELGQAIFVLMLAVSTHICWLFWSKSEPITKSLFAYAIGTSGAYWLIERLSGF